MNADAIAVCYLNNTDDRLHAMIYGSTDAFYDLDFIGPQGNSAREMDNGQICVVFSYANPHQVRMEFRWHSFEREETRRAKNRQGIEKDLRVFYGQCLAEETLTRGEAKKSARYLRLFQANGQIKRGSVSWGSVPKDQLPHGLITSRR